MKLGVKKAADYRNTISEMGGGGGGRTAGAVFFIRPLDMANYKAKHISCRTVLYCKGSAFCNIFGTVLYSKCLTRDC